MGLAGNTLDLIRSVFQRDTTIPVGPDYFKDIDSGFMDMTNVASHGPLSGGANVRMDETVRLSRNLMSRYSDYENMEEFAELGSALDLYADDATVSDVLTNRSLWFEAEDEVVQSALEDLVTVGLKIEDSLWEQARSLCKYGNNFEELVVMDGLGVVKAIHHTPPTVRRIEDHNGIVHGFISDPTMDFNISTKEFFSRMEKSVGREETDQDLASFVPGGLTQSNLLAGQHLKVFEPWEMAHFRLRGKNRKDLYGYSILEPARKAWRRLEMIEDAMVLYKLCLAGDTRVWTPRGYVEIRELSEGDEVYCFSEFEVKKTKVTYQKCNGVDEIFEIKSAHRKIYANKTHPVLVASESEEGTLRLDYVEVQNLKAGVHSLVTPPCSGIDVQPRELKGLSRKQVDADVAQMCGFLLGQGRGEGAGFRAVANDLTTARYKSLYEDIFDCKLSHYMDTSEFGVEPYSVCGFRSDQFEEASAVVVKAGQNLLNSSAMFSWVFEQSLEIQHAFMKGAFDSDLCYRQQVNDKDFALCHTNSYTIASNLRELAMQMGLKVSPAEPVNHAGKFVYEFHIFFSAQNLTEPIEHIKLKGRDEIWDIGVEDKAHNFIADGVVVHNTRSPQRYAYYVDVGDVPPNSVRGYLSRIKNDFKKEKFIDPHTGKMNTRYNPLSQDEDIFLPMRKGQRSSEVEVLSGPEGQQIDDAEYFLNKIFAAIKIPKSFLGADETAGRANLSTQDIRFARSVLRVQRGIKRGHEHIARVDLSAKNIDPDRVNYECKLVVPSGVFELAQVEVQTAKLELAEKYKDANFSEYFIWSNVLGMNDEDINKIQQQRAKEQGSDLEEEESERMKDLLPKAVDQAMDRVDKNALKHKSEILSEINAGNTGFAKKMRELKSYTQDIKQAIKNKG